MTDIKSNFEKLAAIDVGEHIEKKANLSYLSWTWAVDQLLRQDPEANWVYHEPVNFNDTVMVSCSVTAFEQTKRMQLAVMDFRNQAITNPDAVDVNKAMMRCLVKAIALHGLGLYIYAGEDLPQEGAELLVHNTPKLKKPDEKLSKFHIEAPTDKDEEEWSMYSIDVETMLVNASDSKELEDMWAANAKGVSKMCREFPVMGQAIRDEFSKKGKELK